MDYSEWKGDLNKNLKALEGVCQNLSVQFDEIKDNEKFVWVEFLTNTDYRIIFKFDLSEEDLYGIEIRKKAVNKGTWEFEDDIGKESGIRIGSMVNPFLLTEEELWLIGHTHPSSIKAITKFQKLLPDVINIKVY